MLFILQYNYLYYFLMVLMVSMDPANEVLLATTQRRWTAFGA